MRTETTAERPADREQLAFWVCVVALLLVTAAMHARPVPFNNEFIYLIRLHPALLANDWSFSQAANEHWLFNTLFSLPARLIGIEALAWAGRIVCWTLCLVGFLKLAKHWEVPSWLAAGCFVLWLAMGQTVVNAEWVIGTFEAKPVAYVCLIFALVGFARRRLVTSSMLLGASFSFHPAVGLWAILAVGIALVVTREKFDYLLRVVAIVFLFSLPGIIPLIGEQMSAGTAADWQFLVTVHMPFHFDPFYFPWTSFVILGAMLAVCVISVLRFPTPALKFLLYFQLALGAFFVLGITLRWLEMYPLLRLMPMRLFPVITPLFFFFSVSRMIVLSNGPVLRSAILLVALAITAMTHPVAEGIGQLRENKALWSQSDGDLETTLKWIAANTPVDSGLLASPTWRKLWYLSNRQQAASYIYPRYDRIAEWRGRIADLSNNVPIASRETARSDIDAGFASLTEGQLVELGKKYSSRYVLSPTRYDFPVIFRTESYAVYALP